MYFYERELPEYRDNENMYQPALQNTKPCYEELSNVNLSRDQKVESILNYLNTQCQTNATVNNINQFWYKTFDWMKANEFGYVKEHNARRLLRGMIENCNNDGIWMSDVSSFYLKLHSRAKLFPNKGTEITPEIQTQLDKIWTDTVNIIIHKEQQMPIRPTFWRYNASGIYIEGFESQWKYGTGSITEPNRNDDADVGNNSLDATAKEYANYWLKRSKGKYKFGLELECCVPVANYVKMFEKWQKNGWCDKNLLTPGIDCSVEIEDHSKYPGEYINFEITVQPLPYSEAMEIWKNLGDSVREAGGVFGEEAGAGGHIHADKPENKWKQLEIAKHFMNIPDKAEFFGRGEHVETNEYFADTYGNGIGAEIKNDNGWKQIESCIRWKETLTINDELSKTLKSEGKLKDNQFASDADIEISALGRGAVNFSNKHTIEFRGFNSRPDPQRNLEVLAKELAKVLGDEVVYDKDAVKESNLNKEVANYWKDYDHMMKTLGFDDEQIQQSHELKFEKDAEPAEMIRQGILFISENTRNNENLIINEKDGGRDR